MDHANSWSLQSRRKQPSLYDEYLSQERQNTPSSPRADQLHHSPPPEALTIRTVSPDPGHAPVSDDSLLQTSSARSLDRNYHYQRPPGSPPTAASLSAGSRRRPPPPISTSSTHGNLDLAFQAIDGCSQESSPTAASQIMLPRSPSSPASATASPTASTFATALASRYFQSNRKSDTMSSSELYASHTAAMHNSRPSGLPAPSANPPLPPSASHPGIIYESLSKPSNLASSVSHPAFAATNHSPSGYVPPGLRPQSSDSDVNPSISDSLPTANTRRVLHLMKTLCGRMSGSLMFRRDPAHVWTSSHCFIDEPEGSLMFETEPDSRQNKRLVSDLRGCQVTCHLDLGTVAAYLLIRLPTSNDHVHLKLPSQADLESWYAALLCWQPIPRKGLQNKLPKHVKPMLSPRPSDKGRQDSDPSSNKESPIIKIGRMVFWDSHVSFGNTNPMTSVARLPAHRMYNQISKAHGARRWRRVSCTLRENGELKFFAESDNQVVAIVQLSRLCRCAIVRLDPSVMNSSHCIAIFPQYVSIVDPQASPAAPVYLTLESRTIWEVWFVLLTAFTVPQIYGPSDIGDDSSDEPGEIIDKHVFRMERALTIRVNDARIFEEAVKGSPASLNQMSKSPNMTPSLDKPCGYYANVNLDGQVRATTQIKDGERNPSWRQDFDFSELPAVLSHACIVLKYRPPDSYASHGKSGMPYYHDAYGQLISPHATNTDTGHVGVFRDQVVGRVDLDLDDFDSRKDTEHWYPVLNEQNVKVGDLSLRLQAEDSVILMREAYENFSQMLHRFETGLTVQMSLHVPMELKRLSENLTNIFQASGRIVDWLMSLIEDEVDGVNKVSFLSRAHYGQQPQLNAPPDSERLNSREMAVRDMNKNAALEANLLFRGNTLLTKALDAHMRRVGSEYLGLAIGQAIEDINESDLDCEVDPNRVANANDLQRNWTRLIAATEAVWDAIQISVDIFPQELKLIFRHIRACAEDKYGDFLRTIKYSSVSGFLFLRFLCPAVLNPRLFGLLKADPQPRSRRTFTLVAKSLQTLANMATFGSKEYWMEPMNAFLTSHRTAFKDFVDSVCVVAHEPTIGHEPLPSHLTPNSIRSRLPSRIKQGLLTLPYLLDEPREYSNLVELWLQATSIRRKSSTTRPRDEDKMIQSLHAVCKGLHQRREECLYRAAKAERPNLSLEPQWEALVDTLQATSTLSASDASAKELATRKIESTTDLAEHEIGDTPMTKSLDALRISGAESLDQRVIGATPPLEQVDWTTAPDAGAATAAAASLLTTEGGARTGFALISPTLQRSSSPSSPALGAFSVLSAQSGQEQSGPTSAPSSRPGSSMSMRAASRLTRMRSGPHSDTEEAAAARLGVGSSLREGSRRRDRSTKRDASAKGSKEGSEVSREGEFRDVERQRIRDLVGGLTFGRRRANEKAAAAASTPLASPSVDARPPVLGIVEKSTSSTNEDGKDVV